MEAEVFTKGIPGSPVPLEAVFLSRASRKNGLNLGSLMSNTEIYAGRYELTKCLGRGGMGEVWLAYDLELHSELALKFLKETFSDEHTEILRRETRQARMLAHRHILRIFDFIRPEGERAAISMEFAPGGTIAERLTRDKPFLEVPEIEEWILQTCEAISYLHEDCGIVHRDLKSSNLMLDSMERVKVSDFGLSAGMASVRLDQSTQETIGTLLTLHFASPQIILNPHEIHPLNDIYALGVTIYHLLTGTFPFFDPRKDHWQWDPDNLLSMSERREIKKRNGGPVPLHWDIAIARCLAEDPADRPASARELASLLKGETRASSDSEGSAAPDLHYSPISLDSINENSDREIPIGGKVLRVVVVSVIVGLMGGILWGLLERWKTGFPQDAPANSIERSAPPEVHMDTDERR